MDCGLLEPANRVPDDAPCRPAALALKFYEQQTGHLRCAWNETQQRRIQQLDGGRLQGQEVRDRLGHGIEVGKAERHARDVRWNGVETPVDPDHDTERAFGANEEIDLIA